MSKETVVYEDGPIEETTVKETKEKVSLTNRILFFPERHPKVTKVTKTVSHAVMCGFAALGMATMYVIVKYGGNRGNTDLIESSVTEVLSDTDITTE